MTQPDLSAQSGASGAQSGTGTDGSTTGQTIDPAAQSGQQPGSEAAATVSRAEFDQIRNQLQAADRNRDAAEKRAKALEDAALSEEEKRKRDLEQAQKDLQAKDEEIKQLRLQTAFLNDNTYDWHNPQTALKLADLSGVQVDGDKVTGLKEALKAVADSNPYLLKPKGDGAPGGAAGSTTATGVTGVSGQGGAGGAGGNSKTQLEKRFPQLRGRTS